MCFGYVDAGTLSQKRHRILERPAVFRIGQITEFDDPRSAIGSWRVPRFNQPFVIRDQAHNLRVCAAGIPAQTNQFIQFRMSSFICLDRLDTVGNGIEINAVAAVVTTRFFRVRRFRLEFLGPHALITNAGESR